jgi:hypothetical protein
LAAPGKLDRTVIVGTDGASFCLFHPEDLRHREDAPGGWTDEDFACGAEFDAGTFVGWSTGGDGGFRIRVTDGELTPRESASVTASWDFRYRVRHGRVLLDNGDHLPPNEFDWPIRDDLWFELPDGDYRVTVSGIREDDPPEPEVGREPCEDDTLAEYVIRFQPVRRLEQVKVRCRVVLLVDALYRKPKRAPKVSPASAAYEEDTAPLQRSSFPAVVVEGRVLVPGFDTDVELPQPVYRVFEADRASGLRLHPVDEVTPAGRKKWAGRVGIVALVAEEAPAVATLARLGGRGYPTDADPYPASLRGRRLVRVTALERSGPAHRATVEPLVRPEATVAPSDLAALKEAFAAYAGRDAGYRTAVPHPDYEAERVAATDPPSALTNILLHHVQLPEADRRRLLPLSDADRVRALLSRLPRAGPTAS